MAKMMLSVNGRPAECEVLSENGALRVRLGEHWYTAELEKTNQSGLYSLLIGGRSWEIFARERANGFELLIGNRVYSVDVGRRRAEEAAEVSGVWTLTSPMAGQVVEVRVESGDEVQAGQTLVVIESMKMNNELTAARGGAVSDVQVSPGMRVERGRQMLRVT